MAPPRARWALALALLVAAGTPGPARAGDLYATWIQRANPGSTPGGPGKRGWFRLTHDPLAQRTVVIGGSGSTYLNDIWYYDHAADLWTNVEPFVDCAGITGFTPPAKRDEHVVEYDPVNHLYWMFGGSGFNCKNASRTAGAGTTSSVIVDPALAATTDDAYKDWTVSVGTSSAYVASYSAATRRLTLATPIAALTSGSTYLLYPQRGGGTWYYDPSAGEWSAFEGPHWAYPGPLPLTRLSPAFARSTADDVIVMFGGSGRTDTWVIDLATRTWVQMIPNGAPGTPPPLAQLENAMAYDSVHDVFVLFGGLCKSTSKCGGYDKVVDDTWTYRLSTNTWTKMAPAVKPPARQQPQMTFDAKRGVTVMYGGSGPSGTMQDLWVYDYATNTWTELTPGFGPGPLRLGSMVYLPADELSVLYSLGQVWLLALGSFSADGNPVPSLVAITPSSAQPGEGPLTVTVTGGNFLPTSKVRWNGSDRPTTYGGPNTLTATIGTGDLAAPGLAQVTVFNPAPGGGTSAALPFNVAVVGKDLVIENLTATPTTVPSGGSTTVAYRIANRGTQTVTETYTETIYVSTKDTFDGTAVLLGQSHGHTTDLPLNAVHEHSQVVSLPALAPGAYFVLVRADALATVAEADEANNVRAIPVTVPAPPPGEIVIDNAPAGVQDPAGGRTFSGAWCKSARPNPFGADSLYACGSGADAYRWTPAIPATRTYDVYVWWTSATTRSKVVPITVVHQGGSTTRTFNQQVGGGAWQLHGRYTLGAAGGGYVEVTDGGGPAAADAVRLTPVD